MTIEQSLSYNLRRLRNLNRYSQDAISKYLNISRATYIDMEKEVTNVRAVHLYKLKELYNCSIEEFFLYINTSQNEK